MTSQPIVGKLRPDLEGVVSVKMGGALDAPQSRRFANPLDDLFNVLAEPPVVSTQCSIERYSLAYLPFMAPSNISPFLTFSSAKYSLTAIPAVAP